MKTKNKKQQGHTAHKEKIDSNTKANKSTSTNIMQSNNFDPSGSYTGVAIDRYEIPQQDADDL